MAEPISIPHRNPARSVTRGRPARARLSALAATVLLIGLPLGVVQAAVPRVAAAAGAAPAPPSCPAGTYPPGAPYQLAFHGTLAGNLSIQQTPVGPINLPSIAGNFCGLLVLPSERALVPPSGLAFASQQITLSRATVPATVVALAPSVGSADCSPSSPDYTQARCANPPLNLTLTAPVAAQTGLFGVQCDVPTTIALSTETPGGQPLSGSLAAGATATLVSSGFTVGPAISTGASGTCPSFLAAQVDNLLALPNDHTETTVQVTLSITFVQ